MHLLIFLSAEAWVTVAGLQNAVLLNMYGWVCLVQECRVIALVPISWESRALYFVALQLLQLLHRGIYELKAKRGECYRET